MATSVTSTTLAPTTVPLSLIPTSAASSTTGVSSVTSSMSSAAASTAAASKGFFAPVWDCLEYVRNCLSKLPLIGWIFGSTAASTTATSTAGSSSSAQWTDAELVNMIRGQFIQAGAVTAAATAPVPPNADTVNACLNLFGQIQAPSERMNAFIAVQTAVNGINTTTKAFYDAMSDDMKTALRQQIYVSNGNSDDFAGASRWPNVGGYVVENAIHSDLAKNAAVAYLASLNAASTSSASSSSSASSTTSAASSTTI